MSLRDVIARVVILSFALPFPLLPVVLRAGLMNTKALLVTFLAGYAALGQAPMGRYLWMGRYYENPVVMVVDEKAAWAQIDLDGAAGPGMLTKIPLREVPPALLKEYRDRINNTGSAKLKAIEAEIDAAKRKIADAEAAIKARDEATLQRIAKANNLPRESLVHLEGKVLSVTSDGVLVSIGERVVFVSNTADLSLVDGDEANFAAIETGVYKYGAASGAIKTVRAFKRLSPR